MAAQFTSFATIGSSILVSATLVVLAWKQRPRPGATAFAVLMMAATWWIAVSSIGLFTIAESPRVLLHKLAWISMTMIPVLWLLFTLEYTSRDEYVTPTNAAVLLWIPTLTLALAWTNELHHLVYESMRVNVYGVISLVSPDFGPWYWIHLGYSYLLFAVGTFLVLQLAVGTRRVYQIQAGALLIAILAPWLGNISYVLGLVPVQNFDLTPYMFIVSGGASIAALSQFNLLEAVPVSSRVAWEHVVQSMEDGVLVVDTNGRIANANSWAANMLGTDEETIVDSQAGEFVPDFEALADPEGTDALVVERCTDRRKRFFEFSTTPLIDDRGRQRGQIVTIRDITDRRNRVQHMDVLNRVLRHNLRNEMNIVHGLAEQLKGDGADVQSIATEIQDRSMDMVSLGNKARQIDDILDSADDTTEVVDLHSLIDIQIRQFEEDSQAVTFEVDSSDDTLYTAQTVGTVVKHLIDNAIRHNPADEPTVWVETTVADDVIELTIADDGPGIPEAERTVLRTGEETDLQHSSGIGLWLVKWAVESMGGTITVSDADRESGGSRVTVELPRLAPPEDADREPTVIDA
jgi:PAS domain S-box-containing protein